MNCDLYWKYKLIWGFPGSASGKKKKKGKQTHLPIKETQETCVRPLGWEDTLKEGMATHSSILA